MHILLFLGHSTPVSTARGSRARAVAGIGSGVINFSTIVSDPFGSERL